MSIAVDAPGCLTIAEAGYRAGEVTLAALLNEGKRLEPDLRGVKG